MNRHYECIVGRFYVAGALILAPLGTYIQYFEERMGGPRSFTMAAAADAAVLMLTTSIAFWFALRRKIPQHRQWMTRSYAVAIVFLEVRWVACPFGSRLCITLTYGCPTLVAVFWRQGRHNLHSEC